MLPVYDTYCKRLGFLPLFCVAKGSRLSLTKVLRISNDELIEETAAVVSGLPQDSQKHLSSLPEFMPADWRGDPFPWALIAERDGPTII